MPALDSAEPPDPALGRDASGPSSPAAWPTPFPGLLEPAGPSRAPGARRTPPSVLRDLNLDQIVSALLRSREAYDLGPLYESPAASPEVVTYRQDVARELERPDLRAAALAFTLGLREVRAALAAAERRYHPLQRARVRLEAARAYVQHVAEFASVLDGIPSHAPGWEGLRDFLRAYVASVAFRGLRSEADAVEALLAEIQVVVHLKGRRGEVRPYRGEPDYGREVERTFERFERTAEKEYRFRWPESPDLDTVETEIVERIATLFPAAFGRLAALEGAASRCIDPTVARVDREIQFFLAYLELTEPLRRGGRAFVYPEIVGAGEGEAVEGMFDLALATREDRGGSAIVPNDYALASPEQMLVVTGPNQGGKTTFARAFGQLHHLAGLGLAVPAAAARVRLPDRILTHFGGEERLDQVRGRLEDDLRRLREILEESTSSSLVVLNESFSGATVQDALALGTEILRRFLVRGVIGVCVTFLDELSRLGPGTVSLVAEVAPHDPNIRTFRLSRRPADGQAYARALAERHGLAYTTLLRRLSP